MCSNITTESSSQTLSRPRSLIPRADFFHKKPAVIGFSVIIFVTAIITIWIITLAVYISRNPRPKSNTPLTESTEKRFWYIEWPYQVFRSTKDMALRPFRKTKSSVDFELGVISPPQPQCTFSFLHPSASNPLGANPVRGKRTCPLIGNSCQVPILDLGLPDQMFLHTRMHTPETGRHFITVEEICPPSRATSHCSKPLPPLPPEETQTRASSPKPVVYAHIHNSPSPPKSNLRFKASQLYLRDDYRAHAPVLPISPLKPLSIIPSIPRPLSSDEEVRQYMSPRASTLDELITVRYGGEKIELEENDGLNMDLYESP